MKQTVLNGNNRSATLTKVNGAGVFQWSKQYSSGPGIVHYDSSQTSDGGTLIAGNYNSDLLARKALIFKTNQTGAVVWKKIFDEVPSQAGVVREANDGGVIAAGCAGLPRINLITFKLGATGNVDGGCAKLKATQINPSAKSYQATDLTLPVHNSSLTISNLALSTDSGMPSNEKVCGAQSLNFFFLDNPGNLRLP